MEKQLRRNTDDKVIGGVCSGLAEYLEIDTTVVRLGLVLSTLFWGIGPIAYLIMWIVIPPKEN